MKVVIVGAGPAGLITALNLLQRGVTPLVLKKGSEIIVGGENQD
ncbi:MAG: FAD-dependent monooxygenase [Chloroflexi bacterium]|nr:FAD-dependent monooxygenase [Chloroflexota bacterium]